MTGIVNPSGKLSETFPVSLDKVPAANGYIDTRVTRYTEGLDVGYRYFDRHSEDVLFPFGYGLSYSVFEYRNLELKPYEGGVTVSYEIANTSPMRGKEVSQIYVREVAPAVYRPYKELKEYAKDDIKAGESVKVQKKLPLTNFSHWSAAKDRWEITDGVYEILIGASSSDVRLRKKLLIEQGRIEWIKDYE